MKHIALVTDFEKAHFDPSSTTVRPHRLDLSNLVGIALNDRDIVDLSGAPTGSSITVFHKTHWKTEEVEDERVPAGVFFRVENEKYIRSANVLGLFADGTGTGLYLKMIDFKPGGPRGLAARMLAIIVRRALRIPGATRLHLLAAGGRTWGPLDPVSGERWGGFIAWPTYGFDMELLPRTLSMSQRFPYHPAGISSCRRVRAVLGKVGGREFWRLVGDGSYMDFDLNPSSPSISTLDSFLGEAGI